MVRFRGLLTLDTLFMNAPGGDILTREDYVSAHGSDKLKEHVESGNALVFAWDNVEYVLVTSPAEPDSGEGIQERIRLLSDRPTKTEAAQRLRQQKQGARGKKGKRPDAFIKRLHDFNVLRDLVLLLAEMLAEQKGWLARDIHVRYNIPKD